MRAIETSGNGNSLSCSLLDPWNNQFVEARMAKTSKGPAKRICDNRMSIKWKSIFGTARIGGNIVRKRGSASA